MDRLGRRSRGQTKGETRDEPAPGKKSVDQVGREGLAATRLLLKHEDVTRLGPSGKDRLDGAFLHRAQIRDLPFGVKGENTRNDGIVVARKVEGCLAIKAGSA